MHYSALVNVVVSLADLNPFVKPSGINEGLHFMREYLLYRKSFALGAAFADLYDRFFLTEYGRVRDGNGKDISRENNIIQ